MTDLAVGGIGTGSVRERLRRLDALNGPFPTFDPAQVADTPSLQFLDWLDMAVQAGVPEPHAMTLSTLTDDGSPDARILLLKDLDEAGWQFATSAQSAKGRQLSSDPRVCLTFYWPLLGRQVRLRGEATDLGKEAAASDFRARSRGSRMIALLDRQSEMLDDARGLDAELAEVSAHLCREPDLVSPSWRVYTVFPHSVEFWQADSGRRHTRLIYHRTATGWERFSLWP